MNRLSRSSLPALTGHTAVSFPAENQFSLPEKILQFGTGVLLRGLPDLFVELANRQGIFNGRIVVVKSTDGGDAEVFNRQDNLYTLCTRAFSEGRIVEENLVCAPISRVLTAKNQWAEILKFATSPQLLAVISNTTEVGLQPAEEDIRQSPPTSFPGKLLAVLLARYRAFAGDPEKGLVIVPTELIPDNGPLLKNILTDLARFNRLEEAFIHWLQTANSFCSSLVDRIVPGHPGAAAAETLENTLGYRDDLMTLTEEYRLWAIEGNEKIREVLSFYQADPGMVIEPDITVYRELKLRMLNAPHTLCCGLAHLGGFVTVKETVADPVMNGYIQRLMAEIAEAIPCPVDPEKVRVYGREVMDRFSNPFLDHRWLNISLQYTSKMRMRVIPVLLQYYRNFNRPPQAIALGFAAWLRFIQPVSEENGVYFGENNGVRYRINDDRAGYLLERFKGKAPNQIPEIALSDQLLWGCDLTKLPGFLSTVETCYHSMLEKGIVGTLAHETR